VAWIDEHWTHYNWRPDVRALVNRVENRFRTKANTYNEHPSNWRPKLDAVSVDFWSPAGRGRPINPAVGNAIERYVFNDRNPPWIRWYIWQGEIWEDLGSVGRKRPYWDKNDMHYDHVHFTFW
jgi:hypothetical protein